MNIFPVIAVGTCTTSHGGEILDVRYELIQFKDEPREFPPTDLGHLSHFHFDDTLEQYNECKSFSEEEMKDWYWRNLDDGSIIDHEGSEKPDNYMEGRVCIINLIEKDEPIRTIEDAYLKLYLLSQKHAKPNSINLDGIFNALPNVAWTNHGPMDPEELVYPGNQRKLKERYDYLYIRSLDKFPCLTDYVIPPGVRIADASRVRLGAYLSEGTTVMHEGFVNFNAGTLGPAMIEGRISAGVVGLYLTAGSIVELLDKDNNLISTLKASELSFKPDLLFIRNSLTGTIQCKPNKKTVVLNDQLHNND